MAKTPRKPRHEPEVEAAKKAATAKKPRKSRAKPGAKVGSRSGVKSMPSPGKIGRPSIYSEKLVARICAELAQGKSLRTVCKPDDMPSLETVFRWLREKTDFRDQYEKAKNESADALFEEILDIADDGTNDWMEQQDNDGNSVGWKLNGEHVQRSRLRIDVRKWAASKLKPKKFGERVDMNHGVEADNPLAALIRSVQGNSFEPVPTHAIEHEDDEDTNPHNTSKGTTDDE